MTSLVILGCSRQKRRSRNLLPAIERYDGPLFRVFRRYASEQSADFLYARVLSGRFGLISGKHVIPFYDRQLSRRDRALLRPVVRDQLKRALNKVRPVRVFVSVGRNYWPLLEDPLTRQVESSKLAIAFGGIGGRASQLARWLRNDAETLNKQVTLSRPPQVTLLGTDVLLTANEVLQEARRGIYQDPVAARRFETYCVMVDGEAVSAKWLVSRLFQKPVSRFRTADARRVLSALGVKCIYASRHRWTNLSGV